MALINGVKLKVVLKSPLMALIRDANLKSSLARHVSNMLIEFKGHSRRKILNNLWVPKPDTCPKRRLHSRLEVSKVIFAF